MASTVGSVVKQLLETASKTQKVASLEWFEIAETAGDRVASSTVETRLSECINDKVTGITFLFDGEGRRDRTLRVLGVPDAERPALLSMVDAVLAAGNVQRAKSPERIVVDLVRLRLPRGTFKNTLESIELHFLSSEAPAPILVLVHPQQYNDVPRGFDDHVARLRFERSDAEQVEATCDAVAARCGLVCSHQTFRPFDRWAALDVSNDGKLTLSPADALKRFAIEGKLDALPPVVRPAARIGTAASIEIPRVTAGFRRQRMLDVASGTPIESDQQSHWSTKTFMRLPERLAWARALDVEASATEQEWLDSLPRRLGVSAFADSAAQWTALQAAPFDNSQTAAWRDDSVVRVLNASAEVKEAEGSTAGVEFVDIEPNASSRLAGLLASVPRRTWNDNLVDPDYRRLVEAASGGECSAVWDFVRMMLERSNRDPLSPPRAAGDVVDLVRRLLSGALAEPGYRVRVEDANGHLIASPRPWFHCTPAELGSMPAPAGQGEALIERGTAAIDVDLAAAWSYPLNVEATDEHVPEADQVVSAFRDFSRDPNRRGGHEAPAPDVDFERRLRERVPNRSPHRFLISPEDWDNLDRTFLIVRHALLEALSDATVIGRAGERTYLRMRGGVLADIRAFEVAGTGDASTRAYLDRPMVFSEHAYLSPSVRLKDVLTTTPVYGAQTWGDGVSMGHFGPLLPHGLVLRGLGHHVDIRFHASVLIGAIESSSGASIAADAAMRMAAEAAAEEARRRAREDDDDD